MKAQTQIAGNNLPPLRIPQEEPVVGALYVYRETGEVLECGSVYREAPGCVVLKPLSIDGHRAFDKTCSLVWELQPFLENFIRQDTNGQLSLM